jgi:hypothetical protein
MIRHFLKDLAVFVALSLLVLALLAWADAITIITNVGAIL